MQMIVGLGNPGKKYAKSRHNLGWRVIDALIANKDVNDLSGKGFELDKKFEANIMKVRIEGEEVLLVKPNTFMNFSGKAIRVLKDYYKIENNEIWLVSDDLDLPLGWIRVRDTGRDGGHKGLRSVFDELGTEKLSRFRLGIGQIADKEMDVQTMPEAEIFVLQNFESREEAIVEKVIERAVNLILKGFKDQLVDKETVSVI